MSKKIVKYLIVILIIVTIGLMISNSCYAWNMKNTINDLEDSDISNAGTAGNTILNLMGAVIHLATIVGSGIAIIMLIIMGIQYVTKGAEGKADAKKDLEGYLIGAIILFGVTGILRLLQLFIDANLNSVAK